MALFSLLERNIPFFRDTVRPALDSACESVQQGLRSLVGEQSAVAFRFCDFIEGAWLTIELTVLAVLIGFLFAVPVGLARLSRNPLLRWPAFAYMFYFRGTPLLVQIFLIYYGAGQFVPELKSIGLWDGFFREAYFCAVLTLVLNTTAYSAEIIRGGILGVPFGEIEAARAYGMSGIKLYRRIILPKAARIALPAYTNEVVFIFQATSLVSVITLLDLTGVARDVIADTFRTFEVWIFVGLTYLGISYLILFGFKRLERHLMKHLRRHAAQTAVAQIKHAG
ncbi:MAG TPA: ABC transporter permease [Kiloniellales bacterium]|nr:ABC transporter permease [Kiloniellales bacterium]